MWRKCEAFILAVLAAIILSGCNSNGVQSTAKPTATTTSNPSATISGSIFLPLRTNSALFGRIAAQTETASATKVTNAQAFVNGSDCPISLQPTSSALNFVISDVPSGQSSYLVEVLWGKVGLKAKSTGSSNVIISPQTTAAVLVGEKATLNPLDVMASHSQFLSPLIQEIEESFTLSPASIPETIFALPAMQTVLEASAKAVETGHYEAPGSSDPADPSPGTEGQGTTTQISTPTVLITSPIQDSVFTPGTPLTLIVTTETDGKSVARIDFIEGAVKIGETASEPYTYEIHSLSAGDHVFRAKMVMTDGREYQSPSIAVRAVENVSIDLISPENNAKFGLQQSVTLKAKLSGNTSGVQKVEFWDFDRVLYECTSAPYEYVWTNAAEGPHYVVAKAVGNTGSPAESNGITFTIVPPPNQAPIVEILSPKANQELTAGKDITISVQATDPDGSILRVELLSGIVKIADLGQAPYTFTWKNVPEGSYILLAKAIDVRNQESKSAPITIHVKPENNQKPEVSMFFPEPGGEFPAFADVSLQALAVDPDGSISRVEFYRGTTKLGQVASAPYVFSWKSVAPGNHTIEAHAFDDSGAESVSPAVTFTVLD